VLPSPQPHPDFAPLTDSWNLSLRADGYADNTITSYTRAVTYLAGWLAEHHPGVGPAELTRDHVRGWVVQVRDAASSGTARSHFAGVRHFAKWLVAEGEVEQDPTAGIRTPAANDPRTPVLTLDQIRALLGTCSGNDFINRRDRAILFVFVDCGVRLAECTGIALDDVDLRARILFVRGKGSNRSGPRLRGVPFGVKCAQALDRYLRERRKHPHAGLPTLWLGARNRPTLSADGIERMLLRRAESVEIELTPHVFRHSWASQFRAAGGSEGDLMVLGGWRNRQMLDRYGAVAAAERAQDAYRRLALGDRL
jgi:site-specific recombinase XerD